MNSTENVPIQDAESFRRLYERCHLIVYRYIYGLHNGPAEEAEDLAADTFLRAWRARQGFHGNEDAALGWLLHISRNLVIDAHRRSKTRGIQQDIENFPLADAQAGPEEQAARQEQLRQLWKLMSGLPEQKREILVLRYMLGWPVNRIAAHMDMLENTVSVNLKRTIQQLRQDWPESE